MVENFEIVVRMSPRFSVDSLVGLQTVRSSLDSGWTTEKRKCIDRAFIRALISTQRMRFRRYVRPISPEDHLIAVLHRVPCDEISLPTIFNHVKAIYARNSPFPARSYAFSLGLLGARPEGHPSANTTPSALFFHRRLAHSEGSKPSRGDH